MEAKIRFFIELDDQHEAKEKSELRNSHFADIQRTYIGSSGFRLNER